MSAGVGSAWGLFRFGSLNACWYAAKKLLMSGLVGLRIASSFMLCSTRECQFKFKQIDGGVAFLTIVGSHICNWETGDAGDV